VAVRDVAQRFEEARRLEILEGVTFSGGEPMQQAEALLNPGAFPPRSCGIPMARPTLEHTTGELTLFAGISAASRVPGCRRACADDVISAPE
jgi:hypothetical protein